MGDHIADLRPSKQPWPAHEWSRTRRMVLAVGASWLAMVWVHAVAALLRSLDPRAAGDAGALTVAAAAVAALGVLVLPRRGAPAFAVGAGVALAVLFEKAMPGSLVPALSLPIIGGLTTLAARRSGERLPSSVDRLFRRRALATLWLLLAVASLGQIGRLSTHMADREVGFKLMTENPFWYGHECLPAYLYGAELALGGAANIYHSHHYPALDPNAAPASQLEMAVEDPYQYPPQFLLLPAAVLQVSHDVGAIRVVWFALQVSLFLVAFIALARWVGGREGALALWLLPTVAMAWPMLLNFQFGQFHLPALALAVLAMLAFSRGRMASGGLLLSISIVAKLFPAVLLVLLVARRRVQAVAWVVLWGALMSAATLLLLGPAPFVAFFDYHLPRLGSGAAFAFDEAWPEMAGLVLADNQGVYGLARKLGASKPMAAWAGRLFGLAVLALAVLWAKQGQRAGRRAHAAAWLSLLGLASLASPGAWGDYVPTAALWLLALLAGAAVEKPLLRWALGAVATLQFFILGTMPLGDWAPSAIMVPLSAVGAISLLALFLGSFAQGLRDHRRAPSTWRRRLEPPKPQVVALG